MCKEGIKSGRLILAALCLLAGVLSCQPPGKNQGPTPAVATLSGDSLSPAMVGPSPLIQVSVMGEQDRDNLAIVHALAIPFIDPKVVSDHPNDRLVLEWATPYGVEVEDGLARKRSVVSGVDTAELKTDLRVLTTGDLKLRALAKVMTPGGELIMYGEGQMIIKSKPGGIVEFVKVKSTPAPIPKPVTDEKKTEPPP